MIFSWESAWSVSPCLQRICFFKNILCHHFTLLSYFSLHIYGKGLQTIIFVSEDFKKYIFNSASAQWKEPCCSIIAFIFFCENDLLHCYKILGSKLLLHHHLKVVHVQLCLWISVSSIKIGWSPNWTPRNGGDILQRKARTRSYFLQGQAQFKGIKKILGMKERIGRRQRIFCPN